MAGAGAAVMVDAVVAQVVLVVTAGEAAVPVDASALVGVGEDEDEDEDVDVGEDVVGEVDVDAPDGAT